jgi:hypothetical protein
VIIEVLKWMKIRQDIVIILDILLKNMINFREMKSVNYVDLISQSVKERFHFSRETDNGWVRDNFMDYGYAENAVMISEWI